jgi:hypothetical protein
MVVGSVDASTRTDQEVGNICIVPVGGPMQGSCAVVLWDVDVHLLFDEGLQRLHVPAFDGAQDSRVVISPEIGRHDEATEQKQ